MFNQRFIVLLQQGEIKESRCLTQSFATLDSDGQKNIKRFFGPKLYINYNIKCHYDNPFFKASIFVQFSECQCKIPRATPLKVGIPQDINHLVTLRGPRYYIKVQQQLISSAKYPAPFNGLYYLSGHSNECLSIRRLY